MSFPKRSAGLAVGLFVWSLATLSILARGGGGCLEQGTPVLTPSGPVVVEKLRAGDMVLSLSGGAVITSEVQGVSRVQPGEYFSLTAGGHVLRVTAEHPVAVAPGVFRMAGRLRQAETVTCYNGGESQERLVTAIGRAPAEVPAYNLMVMPGGTYIAGGVVVHNKGCFLPETRVRLEDGAEVPIASVKPGDRLMAFTAAGRVVCATVERVLTHEVDEYLVVKTAQIVIQVTAEHPFYVGDGTFKTVEALRAGDTICAFDGMGLSAQRIGSIEKIRAPTRVYNLQTDAPNTFFANGIAVHNKGGCLEQGTPVLTPSGPVAVEKLRAGDMVLGISHGAVITSEVQSVSRVQPGEYFSLTAAGHVLRVTAEHPVAVAPGVFRMAGRLRQGEALTCLEAGEFLNKPVKVAERVPAEMPAYNLMVMPGGTYIAGGVAVHNKGCFLPETRIRLEDGAEAPIASVKPGDRLLAFTAEGRVVCATVERVLLHEVAEYLEVRTAKVTIQVTAEHPFYVGDGTFKTVEALKVGDAIYAFDGMGLSAQRIEGMETIRAPTSVYNLQTDAPNTFFANGIAVHNKGGSRSSFHRSSSRRSGGSGSGDNAWVPFVVFGFFIVIFAIIKASNKGRADEDLDFVYSPAQVAAKSDKTRKLLEFLARQDPSVAPDALKKQAETTFLKLQECWQARDYTPMVALMMPDLHRQHRRQLDGMVRNHEINIIENIRVDRIDIVNIRYTEKEDQREFTALITATARDYYVDDRTRKLIRGDKTPAQFQEFWTFQRLNKNWLLREIEQTRESDALKDENFFEQFTDVGVNQIYGETAAKAGPAGPWLGKQEATKATRIERLLNFLVQTDKLWSRQAMLETSRRTFMQMMLAWESGDPAAAPADEMFPDLAAHLRDDIAKNKAQGVTIEYRNLCVRKTELVLVRNFTENNKDEFVVHVWAHAQKCLRRQGVIERQDEDVTPYDMFLTFGRLDNRWKLKEILLPAEAEKLMAQENIDQDSNEQQLQWYYQHRRAV